MHWSSLYIGVVVCLTILQCVIGTIPTDLKFKVDRWIKCPQPQSRFRFFLDKSLKECVYECVLRSHCKGVAYRRSFTLCELHTDRDVPLENSRDDGGCAFVARNDMSTQSIKNDSCQVDALQTFDRDTGSCLYKECFPFQLDYGTIFGNMNSVGARKKVECSWAAIEKTSTQCQDTGNWDHIPLCTKPIGLGEQCFLEWSFYNVSLCEDTIAQCTNPTPTDNPVCQCPDDYYDNNGGDVGGSCAPKIRLGEQCTILSGTNVCLNPNATCSAGRVCKCDVNYYADNGTCKVFPDDGWIHPSGNASFQIKIHTEDSIEQADAVLVCQTEDATLVKLDSEQKFNFLWIVLKQSLVYEGKGFWTDGMSDDSGVWHFADNTTVPLDEEFWDHLHAVKNECLTLDESDNWLWKHHRCDDYYNFICEK